ncbi:MAG: sulfatase [Alphaproteobacteria bacterium]|nr:sulfatase [Alphaproteobacteria bacterium]
MKPSNLLIIMSDEHSRALSGCYGHPIVQTPNIDALARRGVRFTDGYTNSPICVPARAIFAVGKYNCQVGYWDNADPYKGEIPSWHHVLREHGHRVVSIGKLHFSRPEDDHGFSEEIVPMHVVQGVGDLMGLIREDLPRRGGSWKLAKMAGPGESSYTVYDREIAARAQVWLHDEAPKYRDRPWCLFVSFVCPHFPLTAPPEFYYRYPHDKLPMPKLYAKHERPDHPFIQEYAASICYDEFFDSEAAVKRAIAGYYGLCSFLDDNIGQVLRALKECGLSDNTRIIYTSDHGDNLGARGLWGKSNLYEEPAGAPMIVAGPGVPQWRINRTPVSHVDVYPAVLESMGIPFDNRKGEFPGESLFQIATRDQPDRLVFSEYHAMGSTSGAFMIRHGHYKYVHYAKFRPQLFDLAADPEERHDLAGDPANSALIETCAAKLRTICDPSEVDARAKRRQIAMLNAAGGREAVIKRGDFGFTPAPGVAADFQ